MSMSVGQVVTLPAVSGYETLSGLLTDLQQRCPQPVSSLQVAALLESAGLTDGIAQQRYGYYDIFALAEQLMKEWIGVETAVSPPVLPTDTWWEIGNNYLRGPLGLVPVVLLSFIIAVFQEFGQWQTNQTLILGLAMLVSLFVTSGFIQAGSRKTSGYLSQGNVPAVRKMIGVMVRLNGAVVGGTAVLITLFLFISEWLPPKDIVLFAISYLTLSCLWLVAALLFMLNAVPWFAATLLLGIGSSYLTLQLLRQFQIPTGYTTAIAALVGLTAVLLATGQTVHRYLPTNQANQKQKVVLPPYPQMLVNLTPYFIYGMVYVLFIFSGHVVGWVGFVRQGFSWVEAISTAEMGLTAALGGFILVGGVAEDTIRRFWHRVQPYQLATPQQTSAQFSRTLELFFRREQLRFLVALLSCYSLVLLATRWLPPITTSPTTQIVFLVGSFTYAIMAWGIFHSMFLVTFSQPWQAIHALCLGIGLTLVPGLLWSSTVGFVCGSLGFSLLAAWKLKRLMRRADYFYYTSF